MPWAGEFAGKYLTAAVQVWRLTRDPELGALLERFVAELIALQDKDGYLGPWPQEFRLANGVSYPDGREQCTWDTWGHYHVMLGLLLWHEDTGHEAALKCAEGIADLLCRRYLGDVSPRLVETGSTEMNLAPIHSLCLLYRRTASEDYLLLAKQICDEFAARDANGNPLAGDYLRAALSGEEFFQTPKPRWESLHPIMGLAELAALTGEASYRVAFEHLWHSIRRHDRHNNGGFSSGEKATGNPYDLAAIETCCTIAWMALSVEMVRLTGDPAAADELELSLVNSVAGMHSSTGRWATYNTPMDGVRKASAHEIAFQSREGTPELNCCSVNSARGFGLLSDWALMRDDEALVLNWFGAGSVTTSVKPGVTVTIVQESDYPFSGKAALRIEPTSPVEFTLKLRLPGWSVRTQATINGEPIERGPGSALSQGAPSIVPSAASWHLGAGESRASYLVLQRTWRMTDRIEMVFDMSLRYWLGERECTGKASLYIGPVLLAYDRRFNGMDPDQIPALDLRSLRYRVVECQEWVPALLLVEVQDATGRSVRLCDFGSAGEGGTPYCSWLPVREPS